MAEDGSHAPLCVACRLNRTIPDLGLAENREATVDTTLSFGIDADAVELAVEPFGTDALWQPDDAGAQDFLRFLNAWVELTAVLNELSRAMGQHDFYPFVLPRPVIAKLQFIHCVVRAERSPA